jgi:hypothetical protein
MGKSFTGTNSKRGQPASMSALALKSSVEDHFRFARDSGATWNLTFREL